MTAIRRRLNFERFGIVGYKDETGIGRQCHNMKAVLQIGFHLVAPSTRLRGHSIEKQCDRPLSTTAPQAHLEDIVKDLDGVIVIERNKWHRSLFETAKKLKKILIVVPNWEWFDPEDMAYSLVDIFVVHSQHAMDFMKSKGFRNVIRLTPPVDLSLLPCRTIGPRATLFFHNAGIIDCTDRKGTFSTLLAWKNKRQSPSRLIVRYQKADLPVPHIRELRNVSFEYGSSGDCRTFIGGDTARFSLRDSRVWAIWCLNLFCAGSQRLQLTWYR